MSEELVGSDRISRGMAFEAGEIALRGQPPMPSLVITLASAVKALYHPAPIPEAAVEALGVVAAVLFEEEMQR